MSIEQVRDYFEKNQFPVEILEFPVSSATVELAAAALGCAPARIAKTLSFYLGEEVLLIVAAGDAKVDNRKFKDRFGVKAKMLSAQDTGERIGHQAGGVCPFAVKEGVQIYLDESLKRFDLVYPAAGSSNSAIPMTVEQLEAYSKALGWVDVCKGWQEETTEEEKRG